MLSKGNHLQERFQANIVFAVAAALAALAYPGYCLQGTNTQEGVPARSEAGDMECISYCSNTRPGTALMEVKWRLADRLLSETDLRTKAGQQGLEVTVYSEGFDRGQYAIVAAIKQKALFRAPGKAGRRVSAVQAQSKLPGLEKLAITDVATRLDKPARPLLLMQRLPGAAADPEWLAVRLEGLKSSMEYTFRVPGGRSVVTCQAVVCPVDRIPAPANRAKPKRTQTTQ